MFRGSVQAGRRGMVSDRNGRSELYIDYWTLIIKNFSGGVPSSRKGHQRFKIQSTTSRVLNLTWTMWIPAYANMYITTSTCDVRQSGSSPRDIRIFTGFDTQNRFPVLYPWETWWNKVASWTNLFFVFQVRKRFENTDHYFVVRTSIHSFYPDR